MAKEKVEKTEEETAVSPAKAKFKALMDAYAKQNPVKFAQKKEALEKQLASL